MAISKNDLTVLRQLVTQYAEAAADPINKKRFTAWSDLNSLKGCGRPLVWINEICWWEFDNLPQMTLLCKGKWARNMERGLRRTLFQCTTSARHDSRPHSVCYSSMLANLYLCQLPD